LRSASIQGRSSESVIPKHTHRERRGYDGCGGVKAFQDPVQKHRERQ